MALTSYGYRYGERVPVQTPIDASSAAISVGDIITATGFTSGYFGKAAAGDTIFGVAMESCPVPASDGAKSILVDISQASVYEYPPDAGSVTAALAGKTCDVGGAQSIDIDASADDVVQIVRADTTANTVFIQIIPTRTGV